VESVDACIPSSCGCDTESGLWTCTDDCGGRVCTPAGAPCDVDTDCEAPEVCEPAGCTPLLCTREYFPVCGADNVTYGNPCQARVARVGIAYIGECLNVCNEDADCEEGRRCVEELCRLPGEACPAVYEPVCSTDGVTFSNACEAISFGFEIAYEGECDLPGNEVGEACDVDTDCERFVVCETGICALLDCTFVDYAPVCDETATTWGSPCEARINHAVVVSEGECPERPCMQTTECLEGEVCRIDEGICGFSCAGAVSCFVPDPVCGEDGVTYGCGVSEAHCSGVRVVSDGPCPDSAP
jgi:hypothetical protein